MQDSKNTTTLQVETWLISAEVIVEIFLKILGLCIVFFAFELIGRWLIGDNFTSDLLLSVVVLPAIYVFQDIYKTITPFTVTVTLSDDEITVKQVIFTQHIDCLKFNTVENVELITTLLGRRYNYGTLYLYSYGAAISIPNVKDYMKIKDDIESKIENKPK
jgi:hypothetical protein